MTSDISTQPEFKKLYIDELQFSSEFSAPWKATFYGTNFKSKYQVLSKFMNLIFDRADLDCENWTLGILYNSKDKKVFIVSKTTLKEFKESCIANMIDIYESEGVSSINKYFIFSSVWNSI